MKRQRKKKPEVIVKEQSKIQRDSEIKELLAVHAEGKNLCQMNSVVNCTGIQPGLMIKAEEFSELSLSNWL